MGKRYIGGRSTAPELDAIRAAVTARPGDSVSHEDVARAAGLEPGSVRFATVVNRWRRLVERETAVRIENRDRMFFFLTANEALDRSKIDLHRVGRATGKLHLRVASIDTAALSGERRELHGLMTRETAALLDSARRSAKAIQGPKAVRPANLRLAK